MLEKNKKKLEAKKQETWTGYYTRTTKNKKAYTRKQKHKSY